MNMRRMISRVCVLLALTPLAATANDWVIGRVAFIDDYRALDTNYSIMVELSDKTYYSGGAANLAPCTQRYRIVVGQEGMTAEVQKSIFALLLSARATGDRVRLFVNPANRYDTGYCAVQLASVGDF